jgi:transcription initiation factor TFIIIB Brf1 subunit/transcription initiation factor TFIIB
MKCKKCGSENLKVVKSGPHNKLVCADCLAYQKFLSASELKIFIELQAANKGNTFDASHE